METTTPRPSTRYKFTASVIMAIEAVMRLVSPTGLHRRLKGATRPDDFTKLPQPTWSNFNFFSRILASPVRRKKRLEGDRMWVLEREVEFEFRGHIVARVFLEGIKPDGTKGNRDNNSCWTITKISYATVDPGTLGRFPRWNTFECEVTGYTSFLVE